MARAGGDETLRNVVRKYLGGNHQFKLTYNISPRGFEFTSRGRIAFTILTVLLCVLGIIDAAGMVTIQDQTILWYYWVNKLAGTLLLITYPLLIILTIDALHSKSLKKRHIYEFAAVVATYTASRVPRIFPDTQYLLTRASAGFLDTEIFIGLLNRFVLVLLGVYIVARLAKGRAILVKQVFLLLTVYMVSYMLLLVRDAPTQWDYSSIWQPSTITRLFILWDMMIYAVAAAYFFSYYLKLRKDSLRELVSSGYSRAALFLFGAYNVAYVVYNDFYPKPGYLIFNLDLYSIALHLVFYAAFIAASLFSFRLNLGEPRFE